MWEEEQICPGCGRNSRYGLRHKYCERKGYLEGLSCLWAYEGLTKNIIGRVKYKFKYDCLGELLKDAKVRVRERPEFDYLKRVLEKDPVVVPVPLSAAREKWRGFNQAEMAAEGTARELGLVKQSLLIRVKETGQQVGRSREERLKMMEGAFEINSKSVRTASKSTNSQMPEEVLLIDDVWTTGVTMQECAKTLKRAGVGQVWGWVLAR